SCLCHRSHDLRGAVSLTNVVGYVASGAGLRAACRTDHGWGRRDMSPLRILVSNDDGILAPGIALLAEVCREVGQVTVVAPDREQSGTAHSLTLHRPLRPLRRHDGAFQVDGTPTDCVLLAVGALMPDRPAFVFSGVNHG